MLRALVVGAFALVLVASAPARAQTIDAPAAQALFEEGRSAFEAGEFTKACAKFAESQRLDPGAGTLINLAACREKLNQLAGAWEAWQGALAALPKGDPRRPEVARRADAIESRVPKLVIELAPGAPPDCLIVRDGVRLGRPALGVAIPVDAGAHKVEVSADGRKTREFSVTLAEGATEKLVVEPGEAMAPVDVAPLGPEPSPKPSPPKRDRRPSPVAHQDNTLAFVLLGVGGVSLGASVVTGLMTLSRKNQLDDHCTSVNGTRRCDQQGLDAASSGKTLGAISTVTFAVGAVAATAGVYLLLSSGKDSTAVGANAAPHGGTVMLRRSF